MSAHTNAEPAELSQYLKRLERELVAAPPHVRREVIADVRAHAIDALAEGRSMSEVLGALGPIGAHAAHYRDELGLPDGPLPDSRRASVLLHTTAAVVGVLTGCLVAFLVLPVGPMVSPVAEAPSLTLSVLAFLPALLAFVPLVLPQRARIPVAVAGASAVAMLAAVMFSSVGMLYVPLAVLMWAAVVVPWRIRHGLNLATSPLWRIFGGVLLALPGLLLISSVLSSTMTLGPVAIAAVLVFIACAVLFAFGVRLSYVVSALIGLALMLATLFTLGFLTIAIWWVGGAYLSIGISAVATLPNKKATQSCA